MARIVLIHGYSIGLSATKDPVPSDLRFSGFSDQLKAGEAVVFPWYQEENHSFLSLINPFFLYQVYTKEKIASESERVLLNLKDFFKAEQPKIIVCHSLGAALLIQFLNRYKLERSVQDIVFVQADLSNKTPLPKDLFQVKLFNIFCYWDPALMASWLINGVQPAGLTGWEQPEVENKFVPLFGHWNLHDASISQKQFAQFVSSL